MNKARKEELLHSFPATPGTFMEQMKGKGAANFVVLLVRNEGGELFARCYHRYANGEVAERQRYVFAKDGRCRYGVDFRGHWSVRSEFREPVFCMAGYGYTFDNTYCVLNADVIKHSCMKYAPYNQHSSLLFIEFMGLYCQHPNVEYLMKTGYGFLISEEYDGYWGTRTVLSVSPYINWKSNNLLKMLGLTRTEFKALQGQETKYPCYRKWRDIYPEYSFDDLICIAGAFRYEEGTAQRMTAVTGLKLRRIARYLNENSVNVRDYSDYIDQCMKLKYNIHDTAVSMPHDFQAMHTRCSSIIKYGSSEGLSYAFKQNMELRNQLWFSGNGLFIRQPESFEEIVAEGASLHHCVGGYAERHALGKLHIMFIRRKNKPDEPYYTMEVSLSGMIVQVRGDHNRAPTEAVKKLVESYKAYLKGVFTKTKKVRKTA